MKGFSWKISLVFAALILGVLAVFFILGKPPQAAEMDPEELVRNGWDAFKSIDVVGRMEVRVYRNGKIKAKEEFPSPIGPALKARAMEETNPGTLARLAVFEALAGLSRDVSFDDEFFREHEAKIIGKKKVAGRWAWDVELTPTGPGNGSIRLAFDMENGYPLTREKYSRNGELENSYIFTQVKDFSVRPTPGPDNFFPRPGFPPPPGGFPGQAGGPDHPAGVPPHQGPFGGREGPHPPGPFGGGPGQGMGNGPGPFRPPPGMIPREELFRLVTEGRILFPAHIPDGYKLVGARDMGIGSPLAKGRLQLIFSDSVNPFSIFELSLPPGKLDGPELENFLRKKIEQLQNSFSEGFAMRRVEDGLLVGVGDVSPEVLSRTLDSMDYLTDLSVQALDIPEPSNSAEEEN